MEPAQSSLFGGGEPHVDETFVAARRQSLDASAWVDHVPGWLSGHETLFEHLRGTTDWHQARREMYDRTVDVPRLVASLPADGPGHPVLGEMSRLLERRYGVEFLHISLGYYRDGRDSVAWHGDHVARGMREALVATVSLGEPRRFLLRPASGGKSLGYLLGWGDLLVMGGASQRTWRHAVPKVAHAHPRIAVMFRPTWYA